MRWSALLFLIAGLGIGLGVGVVLAGGNHHEEADADDRSSAKDAHAEDAHADDEDEIKPVCRVRVAPLTHGDLALPITTYGSVVPATAGIVQVAAPYDCRVETLAITAGGNVVVGGALLTITPGPEVIAQRDEAVITLAAAQRDLAQAKQRLDLHLATVQELSVAQAAVELAQLKANTWAKRLDEAGRQLVAPVVGRVGAVLVQIGQQVTAGTPLIELRVGEVVEVHLGVAPSDVGRIAVGQTVQISALRRDGPSAAFAVTVTAFATQVSAETGLLDAIASAPLAAGLVPGESVRGELSLPLHDVLIAPRQALVHVEDGWVVFTIAEKKAVQQAVTVLGETRTQVAIVSAELHAGDALVIEGNAELVDGMAVELLGEAAP